MRRLLKGLIWLGVATLAFFTILTLGFVYTHAPSPPPETAEYIVVISGPGTETQDRTAKGIELMKQVNDVQRLILSGGTGAAEDMRDQAIRAGVAAPNIVIENASRSTLQNALFVRDLGIDPEARILLVTHRYHVVRSRASFRWAGFNKITTLTPDGGEPVELTRHVFAEAIKWPVNIARAALATLMMARDVPRDSWIEWLN